jgi:hypothetical protein
VVAIHRSKDDHTPVGTGVLIDHRRVLTARHVIDRVWEGPAWVSFPKVEPYRRERRQEATRRLALHCDAAVIELEGAAPEGATPARVQLVAGAALTADAPAWWAFGFATRDLFGNDAAGRLGTALGQGAVRLDTESRYVVEAGFSGAGVWLGARDAVAALVIQAQDGNARALTLHQIDAELPDEKLAELATVFHATDAGPVALAQWGWSAVGDDQTRLHWRPRGRGVTVDSERGFRFRGRRRALTEIRDWLDRPATDRRVLVVTGSPGVDKSAVLGRIVTSADATLAAELPDDDVVRATPGSLACAVHAKGKTALAVAAEVARAASAQLPTRLEEAVPLIGEALAERGGRFNVVIDALDEAVSADEARLIVTGLVRPLVESCAEYGVQVVPGSRRTIGDTPVAAWLAPALAEIDLDLPDDGERGYFSEDDLADYCQANLQLFGAEPRPDNPYADERIAAPLARAIAKLATGNFLVGGLVSRAHGMHDASPADPATLRFEATVQGALDEYLRALPDQGGLALRRALTVLAYAEAPGWTVERWVLACRRLLDEQVVPDDLLRMARSPAANFLVEDDKADKPTFRLFHQALNDTLLDQRRRLVATADDEAALTWAFLAEGRRLGWDRAPAYLLGALAGHAARGGPALVDELLADDRYLLHADLHRLAAVAHRGSDPAQRGRARLVVQSSGRSAQSPAERAAHFSVADLVFGARSGASWGDLASPRPTRRSGPTCARRRRFPPTPTTPAGSGRCTPSPSTAAPSSPPPASTAPCGSGTPPVGGSR